MCITSLLFALCLGFMCIGCETVRSVFRTASPDIAPHLIASELAENDPIRPIDSFETAELSSYTLPVSDEDYRARVDELYAVVATEHKKPILKADDPVKPVYDAAIAMLDRYILNSWHESGQENIVHSVHDWLVCYVKYDFQLYDRFQSGEDVKSDSAFDIDGVFVNRRAVCDGLSKAVAFLCAIENVECMTVTGMFASVPHAWNKVRLGETWYNVDVTADVDNYVINGEEYRRQLSHGYYLVSDDTLKTFRLRSHVFTSTVPSLENYDFYADKSLTVGDEVFPCVITSADMLKRVFTAVKKANGAVGKLEVKLDFPGKVNVNDADMYKDEIVAAYECVPDADFKATGQTPYFQSPNGVYLFLIYK